MNEIQKNNRIWFRVLNLILIMKVILIKLENFGRAFKSYRNLLILGTRRCYNSKVLWLSRRASKSFSCSSICSNQVHRGPKLAHFCLEHLPLVLGLHQFLLSRRDQRIWWTYCPQPKQQLQKWIRNTFKKLTFPQVKHLTGIIIFIFINIIF